MALQPGTRLGPYEILAPLGAGGMGEVYRARDPRLGRDVAIKTLPERLAQSPAALARFEREARAVAALSHPNILAIHDVGTAQGVSFAVTELLEGETLRERLARGPLPWRRGVEIGAAIAEGLAAAHSRGIVHRDLKPENLFLTSDGRLKILDFGLARQETRTSDPGDTSSPTVSRHTEPGTVLGTAGYMSPEQLRGATVEARSDIFSFGCVLYEMMAGTRPFQRATAAETMAAILKDDPPELANSGREVPPDLDRVIGHCLEKDPDDRFQSARDLAFDLKAISSGPVAARGAGRAGGIDSLAVLPFVNATADPSTEYLSDGITEGLIYALSQLPSLKVMARSTMFRYKGRDADPQAVGRDLNVRAVLTGRVAQRGESLVVTTELVDVANGWQLWGERYHWKVEDIFMVQEEISKEISEKLQLRLTGEEKKRLAKRHTEDPAAYQAYLKGRFHWNKRNEEGLRKGIEHFRQAIEQDPAYALAHVGLADSYNILGFYSMLAPRDAYPKAKAAARRALELDDGLAEAHASLAYAAQHYDWDWAEAERGSRRAIELNPNYPTARQWYAVQLVLRGRFEEADREMRRALEADPLSLIINSAIGWVHYFQRRYTEAIEDLRKALEMDPAFLQAHLWLALAFEQLSRVEDAIEECRKAVSLAPVPHAIGALGRALARAGRSGEAGAVLAQLAELEKQRYVSPYYLAEIHLALGEIDETFAWLERSYADRATPLVFLAVDPHLDPIRSDPRFADLTRRVGV